MAKVLVVVAHPDDEVMFFGPAICCLKRSGAQVSILSLTKGDYIKSDGELRPDEMRNAAAVFQIAPSDVHLSSFSDGPSVQWDEKQVQQVIQQAIIDFEPTHVLTFDEHGVSGHANHISACKLTRAAMKELREGANGLVESGHFELRSVALPRKYVLWLIEEAVSVILGLCAQLIRLSWISTGGLLTFRSHFADVFSIYVSVVAVASSFSYFILSVSAPNNFRKRTESALFF